jgi:magnesium-protoporphyrin O-methyltransferase
MLCVVLCVVLCVCPVTVTGSLAIPLALKGATVCASDISAAMVGEAQERFNAAVAAGQAAPEVAPKFEALDLE